MIKANKTKMLVDIDWFSLQKLDTNFPDIKKFNEIVESSILSIDNL